jgi:hypothetical protein
MDHAYMFQFGGDGKRRVQWFRFSLLDLDRSVDLMHAGEFRYLQIMLAVGAWGLPAAVS